MVRRTLYRVSPTAKARTTRRREAKWIVNIAYCLKRNNIIPVVRLLGLKPLSLKIDVI